MAKQNVSFILFCFLLMVFTFIFSGCCNTTEAENLEVINLMELTDHEKEIYDAFSKNYDAFVLAGVEPITICKFYWYASLKLQDYETQYELYIDEENHLGWSKEEHFKQIEQSEKLMGKERLEEIRREQIELLSKAVNVETLYSEDGQEAVIRFNSIADSLKKMGDEDFIFIFRLTKNTDGIWKVCFLPVQ